MRGIRYVGIALVAFAVGSGATAAAAAAEASSFHASAKGELKVKQLQGQIFQTNAGEIECTTMKGTGTVSSLVSETQVMKVEFSECDAFGIKATIAPVEFEFNANGTVNILKTVTIKATGLCTITIPAQSKLGEITYINKSGKIEVEPNVGGITSSGSGDACGYETESKGEYAGHSEVELVGGTLEWV